MRGDFLKYLASIVRGPQHYLKLEAVHDRMGRLLSDEVEQFPGEISTVFRPRANISSSLSTTFSIGIMQTAAAFYLGVFSFAGAALLIFNFVPLIAIYKILRRQYTYERQVNEFASGGLFFIFLRSFVSDTGASDYTESSLLEEKIVHALKPYGCVIAIANTKDPHKHAGAMRIVTTDNAWRSVVDRLNSDAAGAIVDSRHSTPGLLEEVDKVIGLRAPTPRNALILLRGEDAKWEASTLPIAKRVLATVVSEGDVGPESLVAYFRAGGPAQVIFDDETAPINAKLLSELIGEFGRSSRANTQTRFFSVSAI